LGGKEESDVFGLVGERVGFSAVEVEVAEGELIVSESDTVSHWIAVYREQIEQSNAIIASMDLDARCARTDLIECNLRCVLFHMIKVRRLSGSTGRSAQYESCDRTQGEGDRLACGG
jgi:hypothetical protein